LPTRPTPAANVATIGNKEIIRCLDTTRNEIGKIGNDEETSSKYTEESKKYTEDVKKYAEDVNKYTEDVKKYIVESKKYTEKYAEETKKYIEDVDKYIEESKKRSQITTAVYNGTYFSTLDDVWGVTDTLFDTVDVAILE
jgi:membrane protein involved in colicin uptake